MAERKATGGAKEFSYNKEDLERIRATDTSSTKAFKESYRKWESERALRKAEEERFARKRRNMILLLILLFAMLAALLILRFFV